MLVLGDAFEALKELGDESVDAVITDPPYGTTYLGFDKEFRAGWPGWDVLFGELLRVAKPRAPIVLFGAQPMVTDVVQAGRKWFRYDMIWEKSRAMGFLGAKRRPLRAHEHILVFSKKGNPTYNPQMTEGKPYTSQNRGTCGQYNPKTVRIPAVNEGTRYPRSVIHVGAHCTGHPTAKPVELMRWLVRTYSNVGDVVLDPFMGSGSTGVACVEEGREFIGVELDPKWYAVAEERVLGCTPALVGT